MDIQKYEDIKYCSSLSYTLLLCVSEHSLQIFPQFLGHSDSSILESSLNMGLLFLFTSVNNDLWVKVGVVRKKERQFITLA